MSLDIFGEHREITCTVVFKQFDFSFGIYKFSYDFILMMFNANSVPKRTF